MKTSSWLMIGLGVVATLMGACRQSDMRTMHIEVPDMADARAVRIVTNAALDEVVGRYDGVRTAYQADLARGVLLYHESARLAEPAYQWQILSRLQEVGFAATVLKVGANPTPISMEKDGPNRFWGDRVTAVLQIPGMKTARDANHVVSAIAYARVGRDDPRIVVDPAARTVTIRYQSLRVSLKNVEHAIACAGYRANQTPADHDFPEGLSNGWLPVVL